MSHRRASRSAGIFALVCLCVSGQSAAQELLDEVDIDRVGDSFEFTIGSEGQGGSFFAGTSKDPDLIARDLFESGYSQYENDFEMLERRDSHLALIESFGGFQQYSDFLSDAGPRDASRVHENYGISSEVEYLAPQPRANFGGRTFLCFLIQLCDDDDEDRSEASNDVTDCPTRFNFGGYARSVFIAGAHSVEIDTLGRPYKVHRQLPGYKLKRGKHSRSCNRRVRRIVSYVHRNDFEAGHLIARRFGGWHRRANLVPQHNYTNNDILNSHIESAIAYCNNGRKAYGYYEVWALYVGNQTLIPSAVQYKWTLRTTKWGSTYSRDPYVFYGRVNSNGSTTDSQKQNLKNQAKVAGDILKKLCDS